MSDDLKLAEQTVDTAIALIDRLMAENKQLRAENERLSADGIHTCHDQCPRYACVLRRERDTALADVERLRTLGDEAADALERVTEERDRLKAAMERLRDVIADHRIGYPGAPGGLLLGSVHADKILSALHDAGYAVVPATNPVYTGGMNDLCVTIPHLSEREKALFVAALKGDAVPTTPPAAEPAPAVCEWTRTPYTALYSSCCDEDYLRNVTDSGMCHRCGLPIKFTEAKE